VRLLLDTHAFLWMTLDDSQLSQTGRELLSDTGNTLLLSAASYWEIAIKISLGKYSLTEPLDDFVKREVIANRLTILPISPEHAAVVAHLEFHHKDPFDRLLAAQAQVEGVAIVSKDEIFDRYGVNRLW